MRKNFFTVFAIATLAIFLVTGSAYAKVGFINLSRLVSESDIGKAAQGELQQLRSMKQLVLKDKADEVNRLKKFIDTNGAKLTPAERKEKLEAYQNALKEYKRLLTDVNEEINKENQEIVQKILKKADVFLKKIAKKEKYTIIIKDPNAIGYLDPDVDITDEVLKELNKK